MNRSDDVLGQLLVGRSTHEHEGPDPGLHERLRLGGSAAESLIASEGYPTPGAHVSQPFFVRRSRSEVIIVIFDANRGGPQNGQELLAGEVAVDEERIVRLLART